MGNSIFLKRIQVTKLFNKFTYDINLENGYNVAILIGPNGFGKTTIFNLVDFIFKPNVSKFKKISIIPFENCICTLSNGNKIELESRNTKKSKRKKNEKLSKQPLYDIRSEIELASSESEEKTIFLKIIDGKKINVRFISINQITDCTLNCFDSDIFSDIEKKLYKKAPELQKQYYFLCNGSVIEKSSQLLKIIFKIEILF